MNEWTSKWMKPKFDVYDTHTHQLSLIASVLFSCVFGCCCWYNYNYAIILIYLLVLYAVACYISTLHMYVHLSVALHRQISMNASIQTSHFDRQHEVQRKHPNAYNAREETKKRSASYHFTIHRNCFSLLHAYYCIICSLCINIPELDWQLAPCATPTTVHFRIGVRTAFFLGSSRYKSSLYHLAHCSIH